jgi:hypothetical protein
MSRERPKSDEESELAQISESKTAWQMLLVIFAAEEQKIQKQCWQTAFSSEI